jgi:starvation-inducible DNA-binding protein
METLINLMKKVLADSFSFYLKTHNYHWNVVGPNFTEYHTFLGTLYTEVWEAVDAIAEQIRILDSFCPGSYSRFSELTEIEEEKLFPPAKEMFENLKKDNATLINTLNVTLKIAESKGKQGLVNFLATRIEIHEKHQWMLNSITK